MSTAYGPRVSAEDLLLCVDPQNIKSWSENVHPNPKDIGSWATSGSNCTLSRDATVTDSPVNGVPLKMVVTGSDPYTITYNTSTWNIASAANGDTWTFSVYAKASVQTQAQLFIFATSGGSGFLQAPAGGITVGTEWQRFSFTTTFTNALTTNIQVRLDGPDSGFGTDGITVPTIWWDGIQVEKNSSATKFSPYSNNATRTLVRDMSIVKSQCSLIGSTTQNSAASPYTFDTNSTAITQLNHISIPDITFLDQSGYTLDFWVKLRPSAAITYHSLTGQLLTTPWISVYANDTTGSSWYLRYREQGGTYRDFSNVTNWNIQTNWTNIIITADTNRSLSFYLNGTLRQTLTTATSTYLRMTTLLGGYSSGGNYYTLQGSLGMAKVYRKTLNELEVRQSFNSIRSRFNV